MALYNRLSVHRGKKRAVVAVAHSMLKSIYHMLLRDEEFIDLGSDYFNQFNSEKKINYHLKKLKSLGWNAQTQPSAA